MKVNAHLLKATLGWGFALWLIGYALGFVMFMFVPTYLIGWAIMPIGVALTLWVLLKRIHHISREEYALLGVVWTFVAVVCDYLFLVLLLKPADGYYKLDVYLYYALTLLLPIVVGWYKTRTTS